MIWAISNFGSQAFINIKPNNDITMRLIANLQLNFRSKSGATPVNTMGCALLSVWLICDFFHVEKNFQTDFWRTALTETDSSRNALIPQQPLYLLLGFVLVIKFHIKSIRTGIQHLVIVGELPVVCIQMGTVIFPKRLQYLCC